MSTKTPTGISGRNGRATQPVSRSLLPCRWSGVRPLQPLTANKEVLESGRLSRGSKKMNLPVRPGPWLLQRTPTAIDWRRHAGPRKPL